MGQVLLLSATHLLRLVYGVLGVALVGLALTPARRSGTESLPVTIAIGEINDQLTR